MWALSESDQPGRRLRASSASRAAPAGKFLPRKDTSADVTTNCQPRQCAHSTSPTTPVRNITVSQKPPFKPKSRSRKCQLFFYPRPFNKLAPISPHPQPLTHAPLPATLQSRAASAFTAPSYAPFDFDPKGETTMMLPRNFEIQSRQRPKIHRPRRRSRQTNRQPKRSSSWPRRPQARRPGR